ncbi:MAG: DUF6531 domain-containing protein [bacterium]
MRNLFFSLALGLLLLPVPSFSAPQAAPSSVAIKRFRDIPVDMATGEWIQREAPDLALKSRGMLLDVSRNYRSRREGMGLFGYGWAWNHAERLEFPGDWVINYVTADNVLPIYPDLSFTGVYARVCTSSSSWGQGKKATGVPDASGGYANVAHFYGAIGSLQPLVAGGWNFKEPDGPSTIIQVDLTSIGATAYDFDHPQYGVSLKLSAGGSNSVTWGHRAYDFDYVDITSDRPYWTWDDINAVQARLELGSYLQNTTMDVLVDTFHLGVTYTRNASGEFKYLPGTTFELIKTNSEYHILNKNLTRVVFGLDGKLRRKVDANGNTLFFHYDGMGRLAHISDSLDQVLTLRYENEQADAKVSRVVDHHGRSAGYAYEGDDLVAVTNVLGTVTQYAYDKNQATGELQHNLVGRTDAEGHSISASYYPSNSMVDRVQSYRDGELTGGVSNDVRYLYLKGTTYSSIPGSGSIQGVVYNASNDVSQVYIREGELIYQDTDGVNLLAGHAPSSVQTPATSAWGYIEYSLGASDELMAHNPGLTTNSPLTATGWGFNVPGISNDIVKVILSVRGNAVKPVCLSGMGMCSTNWISTNTDWIALNITADKSRWTWADISNVTARISLPSGSVFSPDVWIDAFQLEVRYRHFDPGRDSSDAFYFYDLSHNIVATERGGVSHQFAYDDRGNLITWTDGEGNIRRYEYDPVFNKPVLTVDALGQVTTMEYDGRGQLIKTTDALGGSSTRTYDGYGNTLGTMDGAGHSETFQYDSRGLNRVKARNRRGNETTYDYDSFQNCIRITDPAGGSRHASYNQAGWKIGEIDEAGVKTRFDYDHNGRVIRIIQAEGTVEETVSTNRYDGRGFPVESVDPLGGVERTDYDGYGRQVCHTDKRGFQTFTDYDQEGNVVRIVDALGHSQEFLHDERGNVLATFDRRGESSTIAYDGNNNPVSATDKGGNRVATTYDANGNKITETLSVAGYPGCPAGEVPLPLTVSYAYDSLNRVTNKTMGAGRVDARQYGTAYDLSGNIVRETDPLGHVKVVEYDANGNLTNSTLLDAAGERVSCLVSAYDPADRLVLEVSGVGGVLATNRYDYDARGLRIGETDPLGHRTESTYDRYRRRVSSKNPAGTVHWMSYDRAGNKIREGEGLGAVTEYVRDAAGQPIRKTVGVGLVDARVTACTYDPLGRLVRETDPLGAFSGRRYDPEGNIVAETNKSGFVKTFCFDALGRVTNTVDELGYTIRQELDGRGNPCRVTDKLGGISSSRYDVYGRLTSLADAQGNRSDWEYDANDNKIRETDPRGLVVVYAYDAAGRVTNRMAGAGCPDAQIQATGFDALGRPVCSRFPDGSEVRQSYDAAGNLISRTDGRGEVTGFGYDVLDRQIVVRDALGGQTLTRYDERGNITSITDALGGITRHEFDAYDLKRSSMDALGFITRYEYDQLGRLTSTIDPLGGTETMSYDPAGRVSESVGKNGCRSTFSYDPAGRPLAVVDALGYSTWKTYDAAGNVLTTTDKCGFAISCQYDTLGRVTSVTDPASNTVSFGYDAAGNKIREAFPLGRVTTFGYDRFGRVNCKTDGAGSPDARRSRTDYDRMGRIIRETDPAGHAIVSEYDANGNKTSLTDGRGYTTRMEYDVLNRLVRTTDALGQVSRVDYDAVGRIVRTTNRRGDSTRHGYDPEGRLISLCDTGGNATSNRYDALGRKVEGIGAGGLHTLYRYDAAGQLTNQVDFVPGGESRGRSFGYDLLGRRHDETDAMGLRTVFSHDANGNITTVSVFSATGSLLRSKSAQFNSRNQPITMVDYRGKVWRTEFDASGRKTGEVDPLGNRNTTDFNVFGEPVAVTDPAGYCTRKTYDLCGREIESLNAAGERTRYQYDPNGNRTAVIDDDGRAILTAYDALGRVVEINRTMPLVSPDILGRADINKDGRVDASDVAAMEKELP